MLISEYNDQWEDSMDDYLNGIGEDLWRSIDKDPYHVDCVQAVGTQVKMKT